MAPTAIDTRLAAVPAPLSHNDAVRFLQRATFGGRPGDADQLVLDGIDAWLTAQLATTPVETHLARKLRKGTPLTRTMWAGMITGPDQLRKRIGYALSQIFVVSANDVNAFFSAAYIDRLEEHAFGTYRNLLEQVTLSPAMGDYLTYIKNRKANPEIGRVPDENYAREIMQLFSIGLWELNPDGSQKLVDGQPVPTYDQDDVLGLARVFTGWISNLADPPAQFTLDMVVKEKDHEPGVKSFLGVDIAVDTETYDSLTIALDTLADHPNVGPFIGRQLIQRLVTSNPTPAYIDRISAVFDNDGAGQRGNLGAVVRAILTDDEAWQASPPDSFGKLREPVLRFTTVIRALGINSPIDRWQIGGLESPSSELGQQPLEAPSVFNFYRPGYVPPQSELGDNNLVAPEFQIANEVSAIGWVNFVGRFLRRPPSDIDFDLDPLVALVDDVPALVNELESRLCPAGLSPAVREVIERRVGAVTNNSQSKQDLDRVMGSAILIAASTDFLYER